MKAGILYIVGSFKSGGTETQLVEILKGLDRSRFEPYVLCIEKRGALLPVVEELGVEVRAGGFSSILSPRVPGIFREHANWLTRKGVRIVHGFPFHGALYGAILKRLRPGLHLAVSEQAIYGLEGFRHKLGRRWYYRYVDVLTANCEAVKSAVVERDRIDPLAVRVIFGGVDIRRFKPGPARPRGAAEGLTIGCVGRLHPDKGQTVLLRAAAKVVKEFPQTRFILVGDGPQREEVEALVKELGLAERVELLGDRQDVPELMGEMDIVVLPSTSEGFSNAALEGLATGRPVVASDVGGNAEIVLDGEVGRTFPPGDAGKLAACLAGLLEDPGRARAMGRAGRARAEKLFPLEEMIRGHERLYADLLAGKLGKRKGEGMRAAS